MTEEKNRLNKTDFQPQYPYNQVFISEAGHEVHFDNTTGKERIRIAHKDGTYDEISVGGKRVSYTVGSHQQYNKSGLTLTVDENHDVKVAGHQSTKVGGGVHSEIAGEMSLVVGSGVNIVCLGDAKIAVAGDCDLKVQGSMNQVVQGDMNMTISGSMNQTVAGTTTMKSGGDTVVSAANIKLN